MTEWLPLLRELGSFGLVAFIVYWYATHVAPKSEERFLEALRDGRTDYLGSASKQREDYLSAQGAQRVEFKTEMDKVEAALIKLSDSVTTLAQVTTTHIVEARAVWQARGELDKS